MIQPCRRQQEIPAHADPTLGQKILANGSPVTAELQALIAGLHPAPSVEVPQHPAHRYPAHPHRGADPPWEYSGCTRRPPEGQQMAGDVRFCPPAKALSTWPESRRNAGQIPSMEMARSGRRQHRSRCCRFTEISSLAEAATAEGDPWLPVKEGRLADELPPWWRAGVRFVGRA